MKTIIMAGGKGTRIADVAGGLPKGLLDVAGKPVLVRQIECLAQQGFCDIIVTIGHLGEKVQKELGDGSAFGVNLTYYREEFPLGTAGALAALKDELSDDFFLINGDLVFDLDFQRFADFHRKNNALVTLFVHPNNHPYDSELVVTDRYDRVTGWLGREEEHYAYKNRVNAGVHLLSPDAIKDLKQVKKINLDKELIASLIDTGRVYAYNSTEYVKDMGTPDRFEQVNRDWLSGKVSARNLHVKQKAVFLDRDGTVNEYKGFVTRAEDLSLIEGSAQAVAKINDSGYLAVLVTNQPVIARGDCSLEELELIHDRLECLLGEQGAYLDAIYYCPHHPDGGFPGERPEYKIPCDCRKPNPGMILKAAEDFNIDLSQSYMVGDSIRDIKAGKAAGCKSALVRRPDSDVSPEVLSVYDSLLDFTADVFGG